MGGHGGLNILPQKRWNVYNFDNREKVRRDEEAAAKEEQLKREQARKRDAEFRLERLRCARGLAPLQKSPPQPADDQSEQPEPQSPKDSHHINLFEGIRIFDPIQVPEKDAPTEKNSKKMKKEIRVVTADDEKYRLGYGVAGKGVKMPWYMAKKGKEKVEEGNLNDPAIKSGAKKRKKSVEELREERLRREKKEKERSQILLGQNQCYSDRFNEVARRRNDIRHFTG